MNELSITLAGNLGADPELRFTPNGVAVCDLRLAMTPRAKAGDSWFDKETMWFKLACWNQLAEHAAASLKKGDKVLVHGRLQQESYERKDGTAGLSLVVKVDAIGPDLWRCPVDLKRPVRAGSSAEQMPEMWVNRETGEVLSAPVGDAGPLVAYDDPEPAAEEVA
ncbi:MAG: single-stranded DNA-binding protein, partial [Actinomycetota bacterium]|nr:single-stranded DNA-binding protein [Actinomycetota bacterium]